MRAGTGLWVHVGKLAGSVALAFAAVAVGGTIAPAHAGEGFRVGRYEPTAAGEWSFAVDHPWYRPTRDLAVGLTLDYGHAPLVVGVRQGTTFSETGTVIEHQLIGNMSAAFSPLHWLNVTLNVPVGLWEQGTATAGISPAKGATFGDPRIGALTRIVGDPYRDRAALSLGLMVWLPVGSEKDHAGDPGFKAMPRIIGSGRFPRLRWSAMGGFLLRPKATLGNLPAGPGGTVGPEVQFGALLAYADPRDRFSVGPEALLATVVTDGHAFRKSYTSLETLLGTHHRIGGSMLAGVAVGAGFLREPGTPDFRALLRLAYAPMPPRARPVETVAPVAEPEPEPAPAPEPAPELPPPPAPDTDRDGVPDADDACVDRAAGAEPDPDKSGCPAPDRDGDTVIDGKDACPDKPGAPSPDPKKNGCPGLVQIKDGQIQILKPVFFATNKDVILKKSFALLQSVADAIASRPGMRVRIEGHTDNRGKPERNLDLSQRRADSVRRWLSEHGLEGGRLEARGMGQERPIAPNKTAKGRSANRRVEFQIIEGERS